jgi:hypothetical protein
MTREAQIPLFLWIATAVVAHALWGGGADRAAQVIEEKIEIREFAASVRRFVRGDTKTVEIALLDEEAEPKALDPTEPPAPEPKTSEDPDEKSADQDEAAPDKPKKPLPEPKRAPEENKPPEEKKPEEKKEEEKKKPEPELPALPTPEAEKRVAVKQHAAANQADNPDAKFIADEANKVEAETRAQITSNDQDDPQPTPGGAAQSSKDPNDPGNADETRILQSDDRRGERDKAPGEQRAASELRLAEQPGRSRQPSTAAAQARLEGARNGSKQSTSTSPLPAEAGQTARPTLRAADAVPETLDSSQGGWEIPGQRQASLEQAGRQGRKRRELPPPKTTGIAGLLGLGSAGTTPGGMNLNLTPQAAVSAIGKDTLKRERIADGERRRSQHAGHWRPVGIERWRSAIENYVPSVKPGNQTALNTARVPFASYLVAIHNRIHPIFADTFLASLDRLPSSDPMNRPEIYTSLEIVIERNEGRIQRLGVTRTSGVTAFDVAALESVYRAQPFGVPPNEIVSPDGNVYLHWEFHRGLEACGTMNAHPYMLKVQPKPAPVPVEPTPPPSNEPERHGRTLPPPLHQQRGVTPRTTVALAKPAE